MPSIHDPAIVGDITLNGSTSGTLTLVAAAATTTYTLTFPAADAAGALTSNGSGTLSFVSMPAPDLIQDADNDTRIQTEEAADEDIIRFDVGDAPTGYGAVTDILTIASSGFALGLKLTSCSRLLSTGNSSFFLH